MLKIKGALDALRNELRDDWRHILVRSWSVRFAVFWGGLGGLLSIWPAFQGYVPMWLLASFSVVGSIALAVAKLTKQPGAD